MKTLIKIPHDLTELYDYDCYARMSPSGIGPVMEDPYRCPVSTPTVKGRQSMKARNQQAHFVAFTNLNHSLQIPNDISAPKYTCTSKHKYTKSVRPMAKAQKKNFDCYFVSKADKAVNNDAHTQSTWLTSLCAQPVNEIFGKYKRKTEATNIPRQVSRSANSTPGEKALQSAWSSNASNRGTPSVMSGSTKSRQSATERSSILSFVDPNLRVYGFDSDPDRISANPGFALMPVSPSDYDTDETTVSSRASPLFQKVFRTNVNQDCADTYGFINTNEYEQYQNDKRFPEIRPRKSKICPTKKRIIPDGPRESLSMSISYPVKPSDLVESPMHIISLGQGLSRYYPEPGQRLNRDESEPIETEDRKLCSYRLPLRSLSLSRLELQGSG